MQLSSQDIRRIVLWLDGNSNEFSTNLYQEEEREGNLVWETLDVDPANPMGVEFGHPVSISNITLNPKKHSRQYEQGKNWVGFGAYQNKNGIWRDASGSLAETKSFNSMLIRTDKGNILQLRR